MRARDLGIPFDGDPGANNAITDVAGVEVGMANVIQDSADPAACARTGVTAVLPIGRDGIGTSVPAGIYSLNGNGEMTGGQDSGDIFLAFSTRNRGALDGGFPQTSAGEVVLRSMEFVPWNWMDPFFTAVVQAVEEAVLNALVAGEQMMGRSGHISPALPHDQVRARLSR